VVGGNFYCSYNLLPKEDLLTYKVLNYIKNKPNN
jgi:hypothetical protein